MGVTLRLRLDPHSVGAFFLYTTYNIAPSMMVSSIGLQHRSVFNSSTLSILSAVSNSSPTKILSIFFNGYLYYGWSVKDGAEPDAFLRQLGLRTVVKDIMDDMNREFEEARTEKVASRQERRRKVMRQRIGQQ